jgi:hypothetical protein
MATESDENLNQEPAVSPELISSAIESAKSQGQDINPYSVALEAGIAAQVLFTSPELMDLVIAARGDQATFSIDSHLIERCQELEAEMSKLLDVNQEIYDRALEMEERVIQLEAKIAEMEEETEHLTMQLQNSWHLGYKKGLSDGQSQEVKASQKPLIDIELPKEEATPSEAAAVDKEAIKAETSPVVAVEGKNEGKPATAAEDKESGWQARSVIDIELPKEDAKAPSLLDIALPEAEKITGQSHLDVALPETAKLDVKSLLDIELPEAEKIAAKSHIEAEQPKEPASIKSLLDIELPKEQKPSIKSMIDFELPKEETTSQTDFGAEKAREAAAAVAPPAAAEQEAAASYNDRVFNAVSDSVTAVNAVESYSALSWREVETIYQYSTSGGGLSGATPNMVFEPMSHGQPVSARTGEGGESAAAAGTSTSSAEAGAGRGDTQPMRSDTQPITLARAGTGESLMPPILKADAPAPRSEIGGPSATASGTTAPAAAVPASASPGGGTPSAQHKPNPRSTFTGLTSRSLKEPEPPMERTMSQFLGDTNSYINLERVSLDPTSDELPLVSPKDSLFARPEDEAPAPATANSAAAAKGASFANNAANASADTSTGAQAETDGHAAVESAQVTAAQEALSQEVPAQPQAASQAETQTLAGATQALKAEARARAAASAENAVAAQQAEVHEPAQTVHESEPRQTVGPGEPRWSKREADITFDGLTAMEHDGTADVLDLDKLDIFEGMEDIDELNQIEVIEDVVLPDAPPPPDSGKKGRFKSGERIPVVNSDDLHDLIKSRIKKAEDTHEPPRFDHLITPGGVDKGSTSSTGNPVTQGANSAAAHAAGTASGTDTGSTTGSASTTSASSTEGGAAPLPSAKELEALRQGARNKFVGGKASASSPLSAPGAGPAHTADSPLGAPGSASPMLLSSRGVPPEIRKACMILGVRPEDLTLKEVNEKWKAQLTAPGVHPDQGGDTESAIYLNTAKDTLVKWINDQNSKLGKKFGKKDEK